MPVGGGREISEQDFSLVAPTLRLYGKGTLIAR